MRAMLKNVRRLIGFCNGVALRIAMLMLMAMLAIITVHVFMRYLVGASIFWSEEACRFMMIWVSFLLLPLAQNRGQNIAVDFIMGRFRYSRPGVVSAIVVELLVILVVAHCLKYGWAYMLRARVTTSEALKIPMYLIYTVLPYSFGLTLLTCIERLAELVCCYVDPDRLRESDRMRRGVTEEHA